MKQITVIKIGGNVIDNEEVLNAFLARFAAIEGDKILVHGGGKLASRLQKELGQEVQMIDGRRVTDRATLDVVTMVYAGLVNKQIIAKLQALGCNAIGLSGADGNIVRAHRRPAKPIDYGFVGDIDGVDTMMLRSLLEAGLTPVFSAIMHDGAGTLLNCNADSVTQAVALGAAQLAPTDLVFCFEKHGVLSDAENDDSVIARITPDSYLQLKADGIVSGGMIPKIENALRAVEQGVRTVRIKHADDLLEESAGTTICNA
ncbi:MAG: acetylglutamate kinase [Alistipes sp.]|nr:acetylglutamate kinase [Alistipes sp.]